MADVRFFSTFEPATSFYRDVVPSLAARTARVELVLSRAGYRDTESSLESVLADTARVTRVWSPTASASTTLRKVAAMTSYVAGVLARTLVGPGSGVNVFFSTPPFFAVWGVVLRRLRGQPFCVVLMDVYPDVLVANGSLPPASALTRMLRWITRFTWTQAECVFVLGECMRELLLNEGVDDALIVVVRNWANSTTKREVASSDLADWRASHGIAARAAVVEYSGNVGVSHSMTEILSVAERTAGDSGIHYLFIGGGSRWSEVEAAGRDFENVTVLPFQPAESLAVTLSVGDAHLVCLREGFEGLVVPSKSYGPMQLARPLIYVGSPAGEIARAIGRHELGRVVPIGDVDGLEAAVRSLASDSQEWRAAGARARRYATTEISEQQSVSIYVAKLLDVAHRPR